MKSKLSHDTSDAWFGSEKLRIYLMVSILYTASSGLKDIRSALELFFLYLAVSKTLYYIVFVTFLRFTIALAIITGMLAVSTYRIEAQILSGLGHFTKSNAERSHQHEHSHSGEDDTRSCPKHSHEGHALVLSVNPTDSFVPGFQIAKPAILPTKESTFAGTALGHHNSGISQSIFRPPIALL